MSGLCLRLLRPSRRLSLAVMMGALGLFAAPALADPAGARAHFELGRRYFQIDEYRKAIEEFKAAHVEEPDPAFLYNIAECHRHLGETREALVFYRRFLSLVPANAPSRANVEKRIAELQAAPAPAAAARPSAAAPVAVPPPARPPAAASATISDQPRVPPAPRPSDQPPAAVVVTAPPALTPAESTEEAGMSRSAAATSEARPFYKSGWFFAALGGVVVAGAIGVWALSSGGDITVPGTPLGNQAAFR